MATVYIAWQSSSGSSLIRNLVYFIVGTRVLDPHHFSTDPYPAFHYNGDPDPAFHFKNADPVPAFHFNADPDPAFTWMRIRIQLFIFMRTPEKSTAHEANTPRSYTIHILHLTSTVS